MDVVGILFWSMMVKGIAATIAAMLGVTAVLLILRRTLHWTPLPQSQQRAPQLSQLRSTRKPPPRTARECLRPHGLAQRA